MNRWNSESTNQSINDSMNQWMNDSVNPRIDGSMNQRVNASMNVNPHLFVWWYYQRDYQTVASKWINGSTNQFFPSTACTSTQGNSHSWFNGAALPLEARSYYGAQRINESKNRWIKWNGARHRGTWMQMQAFSLSVHWQRNLSSLSARLH